MHHYNQLIDKQFFVFQKNEQFRQKFDIKQNELIFVFVKIQILKDLLNKSHELQTFQSTKSTKFFDSNKFIEIKMKLKYFITQFQLKLRINVDHYSINYVKFEYVINQLNEIILKQIIFKLRKNDIEFENLIEFYVFLQNAFDDLNYAITTKKKLLNFRQ